MCGHFVCYGRGAYSQLGISDNLLCIIILTRLGLNCEMVGTRSRLGNTNSAMTHVLVLSGKLIN